MNGTTSHVPNTVLSGLPSMPFSRLRPVYTPKVVKLKSWQCYFPTKKKELFLEVFLDRRVIALTSYPPPFVMTFLHTDFFLHICTIPC